MCGQQRDRLLIALDGSERAFRGVRYIGMFPSFQEMEVVLLYVFTRIPETYLDFESQPYYAQEVRDLRKWEMHEMSDLNDYMEKAKQHLVKTGFRDEAIHIDIREIETGISRDIIEEARKGQYGAIVAGRRGVSRLSSILLGNVAFKLLEKLSFAPLVLVGSHPKSGDILMGMDGSEGCMRAVETVARYFRDTPFHVMLLHVVRSDDRTVIKEAGKRIGPVFEDSKRRFIEAGFEENRIAVKMQTGVESRAGAIVEEAHAGGYGTIVVGRRGFSQVREFFMGRVGNKVVQLAVEQVVWIVS